MFKICFFGEGSSVASGLEPWEKKEGQELGLLNSRQEGLAVMMAIPCFQLGLGELGAIHKLKLWGIQARGAGIGLK